MKRGARTIVLISAAVMLMLAGVAPSVRAYSEAPAQAAVPDGLHAIVGDGQYPTVTAAGASSAYANAEFSGGVQNNEVEVVADDPPSFGRFTLITEQTEEQPAKPVRWLFLNMPSVGIANFRCDYGPEDPTHASNKNYSRLGAQISVLGGKAQLLCFQRTSTGSYTGYHVYTSNVCVTITGGPHYVVNGTGCVADVYYFNKTKQRLIASGQPFSVYAEVDVGPVESST